VWLFRNDYEMHTLQIVFSSDAIKVFKSNSNVIIYVMIFRCIGQRMTTVNARVRLEIVGIIFLDSRLIVKIKTMSVGSF